MRTLWLYVSGLLMGLYALYATWGAYAKPLGIPLPVTLGDVGEFWLFFLSIATFAIHVLSTQRRAAGQVGRADKDEART